MMNNHRAGDTVKVTIYRGKKKMDVQRRHWARRGSKCEGFGLPVPGSRPLASAGQLRLFLVS